MLRGLPVKIMTLRAGPGTPPCATSTILPMKEYLAQRLDAARDLYLLALALGERGPDQFGPLIREARLAGLDTIEIQNVLATHSDDLVDTITPDLRERLDELLRIANPR